MDAKHFFYFFVSCFFVSNVCFGQAIKYVRTSDEVNFEENQGIQTFQVEADPGKGFRYPYLLRIPRQYRKQDAHLFVEPNNTGKADDNFETHEKSARRLITKSYVTQIADRLKVATLVPIFPRPRSDWQCYVHALDDDTLKATKQKYTRVDLQLMAMIKDAQAVLRTNEFEVADQVIMHGYSASGTFVNRFAVLHPELVRACAAGGVNSIPIFPIAELEGTKLNYPIGIADLEQIAGEPFNKDAYNKISQFIYMGDFDRNDTTLYRDAFSEQQSKLIHKLIGKEMPDRWNKVQKTFDQLKINAQLVTYNATGHEIRDEILDDVVAFLSANLGETRTTIDPVQFPFEEYRELESVQVKSILLKGDEKLPDFARELINGNGTFVICVEDWIRGRNHTQLDEFCRKAGFRFELEGPKEQTIEIEKTNLLGTTSKGNGSFQGFVVKLSQADKEKLAPGTKWTLKVDADMAKSWMVKPDAVLVIPPKVSDKK